jgi:hypothetical protein
MKSIAPRIERLERVAARTVEQPPDLSRLSLDELAELQDHLNKITALLDRCRSVPTLSAKPKLENAR